MGSIECRSIIGAVACDSHNLIQFLKGFYQTFLVHRTCTGDNLQIEDSIKKLLIGKRSELRSRNNIGFIVRIFPKTNLTTYFSCRSRSITRYNLHIDTCIKTLPHSIWDIKTDRVGNSGNSDKVK